MLLAPGDFGEIIALGNVLLLTTKACPPGHYCLCFRHVTDTVTISFMKNAESWSDSDAARANFATRFDHTGDSAGTLWVTYHFEPIPTPSTLVGLVSMGLIGALGYVWRWRRKR